MAKKFYAVKNGRETGIFNTWPECQRQVTGFGGAEFKGFETLAEAEAYLSGAPRGTAPRAGAATAYVDGSYDAGTGGYAQCRGRDTRRGGGMRYCVENGIEKLDIYYDYAGIEKWCTGEWKTNKEGTMRYKEYYDFVKNKVDVRFVKVKGHSGDKYNDMADRLAKEALGIDKDGGVS